MLFSGCQSQVAAILAVALCSLGAQAHRPHLDDGTHGSIASAWEWPDSNIARVYMTYFDCPSEAVWTKINITDASEPLLVGVGIPNATTLFDYRPSLWAMGKTLNTPPNYQADSSRNLAASQVAKAPRVPRGFNAVEYPSEGSTVFQPFAENGGGISGVAFLRANVTVSAPGLVYLVLQPLENRRARAWLSMGHDETPANETGRASNVDMNAFFSATSIPRLGSYCEPWSE